MWVQQTLTMNMLIKNSLYIPLKCINEAIMQGCLVFCISDSASVRDRVNKLVTNIEPDVSPGKLRFQQYNYDIPV